jgi:hypothetical protein
MTTDGAIVYFLDNYVTIIRKLSDFIKMLLILNGRAMNCI